MKILGPRVLLRKPNPLQPKKGEIILPDAIQKRETQNKTEFEVVMIGEGQLLPDGSYRKTQAKPKDVVVLHGQALPVHYEDEEMYIVSQDDIVCIV